MKQSIVLSIILAFALVSSLVACSSMGTETGQTAGYIQVPDGPKIKVIFNGPPELRMQWEKLGMASDGFQVQLSGSIQNVSSGTVEFSEIAYLFDNNQVAFDWGHTLKPGEQMRIVKGFPGYNESTKVLEVRVNGFKKTEATEPVTQAVAVQEATHLPSSPSVSGKIAFVSDRDGNAEIYVMNVDGSGLIRLTNNNSRDSFPDWSQEGEKILFSEDNAGDYIDKIYVMEPSGNKKIQLTDYAASDPVWSPNGREIAFVSSRDGDSEIYI